MKRMRSLTTRLALSLSVLLLVFVSVSGYFIYNQTRQLFYEQVLLDLDHILEQNRINTNSLLKSVDNASYSLYNDPSLMRQLQGKPRDFFEVNEVVGTVTTYLVNQTYMILNDLLHTYSVTFLLNRNLPLAAEVAPADQFYFGVFNDTLVGQEDWYVETERRDGGLYWFVTETPQPKLNVARMIKTTPEARIRASYRTLGVFVLSFDLQELDKLIKPAQLTPNSVLYLTKDSGKIIYSNHKNSIGRNMADLPPQKDIITRQTSFNRDWALTAVIPKDEINARLTPLKTIMLGTFVIAFFLGIGAIVVLSGRITRPIRQLANTMSAVSKEGNLEAFIEPPTKDEIGTLYKSFNQMMRRIQHLMHDNYEASMKQRESQLQALEAQMNPHFLYNTFDTISWRALEQGDTVTTELISSVAKIMRYSIKQSSILVPLKDEVDMLQQYIKIQTICFHKPFTVSIQIDPAALRLKVPKLILQPLVENALLHGLGGTENDGRIVVSGELAAGEWILSVSDGGDGARHAVLNEMLQGSGDYGGQGIRNVHYRLRLHYGEPYGLRYRKNERGGLTAELRIPVRE